MSILCTIRFSILTELECLHTNDVLSWSCQLGDFFTLISILIMRRIKENSDFLKATTSAHPEQCKAPLETAKQSQLESICEIIVGIAHELKVYFSI